MATMTTGKEAPPAIDYAILPKEARNSEFLAYLIAGTLYTREQLTEKEAQQLVGEEHRRVFQEKMSEHGFPMLLDTEENIQAELNA